MRKNNPKNIVESEIELVDRKGKKIKVKLRMPKEIANLNVDIEGNFIVRRRMKIISGDSYGNF